MKIIVIQYSDNINKESGKLKRYSEESKMKTWACKNTNIVRIRSELIFFLN